jgi:hypothetical protein
VIYIYIYMYIYIVMVLIVRLLVIVENSKIYTVHVLKLNRYFSYIISALCASWEKYLSKCLRYRTRNISNVGHNRQGANLQILFNLILLISDLEKHIFERDSWQNGKELFFVFRTFRFHFLARRSDFLNRVTVWFL